MDELESLVKNLSTNKLNSSNITAVKKICFRETLAKLSKKVWTDKKQKVVGM